MIYFRALVDFAAETVALIAHHMATDPPRNERNDATYARDFREWEHEMRRSDA